MFSFFFLPFQQFDKCGVRLGQRETIGMEDLHQEHKNWLCVATLTDFAGRKLCHNFLLRKNSLLMEQCQEKKDYTVSSSKVLL